MDTRQLVVVVFFIVIMVEQTQQNGVDFSATIENISLPNVLNYSIDESINNFGYKLIKARLKEHYNENVVISPTSIAGLLAMILLGSTGTTYDEIAQLIGFSEDILINRQNHEHFGKQLQKLNSNESMTLYANAIFIDRNSKLREVYQSYLERVYRGEALNTDFTDVDKVIEMINEWVKNHTNNVIDVFLEKPLPVFTKVVLLSALYFSGQWTQPFVPEYTTKLPFNTPTEEIMVEQMANFGEFEYIFSYEDGLQMIAFPYKDGVTTMYVLKPRFPKRSNITELMPRLNNEKIESLIGQMTKKKCVVRFPKMELNSKIDLIETLKDLGVKSMFLPGTANFALMLETGVYTNRSEEQLISRINEGSGEARSLKEMVDGLNNPGVHVDSVLHEVKIKIDEFGTEAAAVSSAVMARTAESFYADSPFFMFIRNERTKLVLLSALVFDPTR